MSTPENNELFHLEIRPKAIQVSEGPTFREILATTPVLIEKARELLANDPDEIDEDEFAILKEEMATIKNYDKYIKEGLKNLRAAFNNQRDQTEEVIKDKLEEAEYSTLEELTKDIALFEKQIKARRKARWWKIVEDYYRETLEEYPKLTEELPVQSDFDTFFKIEETNTSFVGESKTWKLTAKRKAYIQAYIDDLNNNLTVIKGLNSPHEEELIAMYENNPNIATVVQHNNRIMEREAKRIAEIERQAKIKAEREAKAEAEKIIAEERAKALEKQKLEQKVTETKQPKERMATETLSDSPFGIGKPENKTLSALKLIKDDKAKQYVEDYKNNNLSAVGAMKLAQCFLNEMYSKNKPLIELIGSPEAALDLIVVLRNEIK